MHGDHNRPGADDFPAESVNAVKPADDHADADEYAALPFPAESVNAVKPAGRRPRGTNPGSGFPAEYVNAVKPALGSADPA